MRRRVASKPYGTPDARRPSRTRRDEQWSFVKSVVQVWPLERCDHTYPIMNKVDPPTPVVMLARTPQGGNSRYLKRTSLSCTMIPVAPSDPDM